MAALLDCLFTWLGSPARSCDSTFLSLSYFKGNIRDGGCPRKQGFYALHNVSRLTDFNPDLKVEKKVFYALSHSQTFLKKILIILCMWRNVTHLTDFNPDLKVEKKLFYALSRSQTFIFLRFR